MLIIKVKLIHPAAKIPGRMTQGSAGFDLYAVEELEVPPTQCKEDGRVDVGRALVPVGIILQLPEGTVGRIASRSGLSINSNIEVGAGWIDSDYRGAIKVELKNFSSNPFIIRQGDRIAQLILLTIVNTEIKIDPHLEETERGASGFGSTDL